jgi:hypothetical protein
LIEPSQFQSNPPLWKQRKKTKREFLGVTGAVMTSTAIPIDSSDISREDAHPQDMQPSTWLSAAEAAAYLNFKVRTIHLWAKQAKLKGHVLSGTQRGVWRFLRSDLDAIVMHRKPVVSSAQPSVLANERRRDETSTA